MVRTGCMARRSRSLLASASKAQAQEVPRTTLIFQRTVPRRCARWKGEPDAGTRRGWRARRCRARSGRRGSRLHRRARRGLPVLSSPLRRCSTAPAHCTATSSPTRAPIAGQRGSKQRGTFAPIDRSTPGSASAPDTARSWSIPLPELAREARRRRRAARRGDRLSLQRSHCRGPHDRCRPCALLGRRRAMQPRAAPGSAPSSRRG